MKTDRNTKQLWDLYEAAVQDPSYTVDVVDEIYREIFKKTPAVLREDFCGTFAVGREWIKRERSRRAMGVDISAPVIHEAEQRNAALLSAGEQKRSSLYRKDVRTVTRTKADVVLAENFSFFVFKTRKELLQYFRASYRSLAKNGLMVLDLAGGPEFIRAPYVDRKSLRVSPPRPGLPKKFTYFRKQERYDPVTAFGYYSIDFEIEGKRIRNAFTYDWRVWSLPEIQECLIDAGFDEVKIFWDDDKAKLSIREISSISQDWSLWLCLAVGVKRK